MLILQSKAIISVNTWSEVSKIQYGITCRRHKRFKITTNFNNEAWVSDITYIWTNESWLYLAGVKNLYTKELVYQATNSRMIRNLVVRR